MSWTADTIYTYPSPELMADFLNTVFVQSD